MALAILVGYSVAATIILLLLHREWKADAKRYLDTWHRWQGTLKYLDAERQERRRLLKRIANLEMRTKNQSENYATLYANYERAQKTLAECGNLANAWKVKSQDMQVGGYAGCSSELFDTITGKVAAR